MSEIRRLFLELSYKGTNYHGWQIQPNALTVQDVLDKALSVLFRQKIETVGCGRTDTGVHATQFFAHFDLQSDAEVQSVKFLNGINALLPFDIAVKRFIEVEPEAHARFDATLRSYEYHIHFKKDPFKHNFSTLIRDELDVSAMNEAANILLEYRDFSCFSKSNTQVFTNNCTINRAEWKREDDSLTFFISADRFLRNMVRAIVGTLMPIGRGEFKPEGIRNIIESKNRSNAGTSVPACGLYLTEVLYPYLND